MSRKLSYYLPAAFLALCCIPAFAQEAAAVEQQPVYAEQPAPIAEQVPVADEQQPAPTAEQPVYAEQPAMVAEQPATEQAQETATQQDSAQAQVEPYIEPAPAYEPPQQTYVQGYGKPPEGFYGYFGYAPPAENSNAGCCCKEAERRGDEILVTEHCGHGLLESTCVEVGSTNRESDTEMRENAWIQVPDVCVGPDVLLRGCLRDCKNQYGGELLQTV